MQKTLSKVAKSEVFEALRERYREAAKQDKTKILDEFVAVAGCHRKHGIRLLTGSNGAASEVPGVDRRTYNEAVREALVVLWEAADRICGKRLKAILPSLVTALEQHGHLALDPTRSGRMVVADHFRTLLLQSSATISRKPRPSDRHCGITT